MKGLPSERKVRQRQKQIIGDSLSARLEPLLFKSEKMVEGFEIKDTPVVQVTDVKQTLFSYLEKHQMYVLKCPND